MDDSAWKPAVVAGDPFSPAFRISKITFRGRHQRLATPSFFALLLLITGWATEQFSLIDVGRYSILLLYIAAIPFCIRTSAKSVGFLVLPIISTVFSVVVSAFAGMEANYWLAQGALQLLAFLFAAGVAATEWRRSFHKLIKAMLIVSAAVVAYGGYQMIARARHLPFAFLPVTNQQEHAIGGLQRGWEKSQFTRASSFFVEPSQLGYFCLWLLVFGLSARNSRFRYFALLLAFAGFLFSQSLSSVLGVGIILLTYFFTHPISFNVVRQIAILLVVSTVALVIIPPLMPEAFAKFSDRIEQALSLDERADSGRVDHLPRNWAVFKETPVWGHGLASMAAADSMGTDVTSVTYALLLMERGMVGTILFLFPWFYVGIRALRLPKTDLGRTPAILLASLNLYTFATSAVTYFLPYWLSLGIVASLVLHTHGARTGSASDPLSDEALPPARRGEGSGRLHKS